jgi:hypothetical protein
MNTRGNAAWVTGVITAEMFTIGLIVFAHWPTWAALVLTLALAIMVIVLTHVRCRWPNLPPPEPEVTYVAMPPTERRKGRVTDVLLPSELEDYYFLFSATVLWSPTATVLDESLINMPALAVDAVLRRAREITQQRNPGNASLVSRELGAALARMQADATGCLQAMAESVQLALPGHDQERLDKLAAVRKEEAIWEHERKYEQSKREYLSGDALKDPGSAVVWWLTRNDDHVEKTVQDIALLAQLSAAANNTDVPEAFQQLVAGLACRHSPSTSSPGLNGSNVPPPAETGNPATDHFDAFLRAMSLNEGDPERALFARRVADLATKHGRPEIADEMIARFDGMDGTDFSPEAHSGD